MKAREIIRADNDVFSKQTLKSHSTSAFRTYITAIKSKPFLLLAGISGTGKSRIVRELACACWNEGLEEYNAQKPKNYEMVQVKPNWHDSSELIGYVSRVSGSPVFVVKKDVEQTSSTSPTATTPPHRSPARPARCLHRPLHEPIHGVALGQFCVVYDAQHHRCYGSAEISL